MKVRKVDEDATNVLFGALWGGSLFTKRERASMVEAWTKHMVEAEGMDIPIRPATKVGSSSASSSSNGATSTSTSKSELYFRTAQGTLDEVQTWVHMAVTDSVHLRALTSPSIKKARTRVEDCI